ncbi:uracil-DNA glycosylase [Candidatus Gracilibacteria bacterium]|nr:uracil-DNA glycosylase [Candidatus Gracilibacteria bacterium]MCF7819537.1 uracil-DNA glycosylase [Candidatus Gracilibacteria bacterium]
MNQTSLFDPPQTDPPPPKKHKGFPPDWDMMIGQEFEKPYFKELKSFLKQELEAGHKIYPPPKEIFRAFELCPPKKTKVVILGQDPYHGSKQAHGLCFSVNKNVAIPPSLQNIYKEIHNELGLPIPSHGNLEHWAQQGVLLLNATLTVRERTPTSHSGKGWEYFTDAVIRTLSEEKKGLVFLLWGNFAKSKKTLIDTQKHHILTAPHPSPFSANAGFFGCGHFTKTNKILQSEGKEPIDWSV